jgi:mannose-6-phosphate isomerase-like protein (cupin superfamily)
MVRSDPPPRFAGAALLGLFAVLALATPVEAQEAPEAPILLTPDDPSLEWAPCGDPFPQGCDFAVLRLGPDGWNSDVFYRIQANTALPAHWHTSQERMILISGEFHVDFDGHDPIVMRAGNYAWGPPGVPHTARCADRGTCLLFVAFVDPPDGFPVEGRDD